MLVSPARKCSEKDLGRNTSQPEYREAGEGGAFLGCPATLPLPLRAAREAEERGACFSHGVDFRAEITVAGAWCTQAGDTEDAGSDMSNEYSDDDDPGTASTSASVKLRLA